MIGRLFVGFVVLAAVIALASVVEFLIWVVQSRRDPLASIRHRTASLTAFEERLRSPRWPRA